MSLLSKIIEESIDADASIASLLRKGLVLAHELKNERLKEWATGELNGFSEAALAPSYRSLHVSSVGSFVSLAGTMQDQPLPTNAMKADWVREFARTAVVNDSIAALQSLLESDSVSFAIPWSADLVAVHAGAFFEGWTMLRAHRVIPRSKVVQICDTVRNKVLEFALELKTEVGDADSALAGIPAEKVEHVVNQYFYGDNNVVGSTIHGGNAQASHGGVVEGNFGSLGAALLAKNVPPGEIEALQTALTRDGSAKEIGPATQSWIQRVGKVVANAGTKIAAEAAERGLIALIRAYLGF